MTNQQEPSSAGSASHRLVVDLKSPFDDHDGLGSCVPMEATLETSWVLPTLPTYPEATVTMD